MLNPRDIRAKQTKRFPFEGAAVSEVALAESLIGARAVASKANGPFSGRVLQYYCCDISSVVRPFNAKEILALLPSPAQSLRRN